MRTIETRRVRVRIVVALFAPQRTVVVECGLRAVNLHDQCVCDTIRNVTISWNNLAVHNKVDCSAARDQTLRKCLLT